MNKNFSFDEDDIFSLLCYEIGITVDILSDYHNEFKPISEKWKYCNRDTEYYISEINEIVNITEDVLNKIEKKIFSEAIYLQMSSDINFLKFIIGIKTEFKAGFIIKENSLKKDVTIDEKKLDKFVLLLIRSCCVYYTQTSDLNKKTIANYSDNLSQIRKEIDLCKDEGYKMDRERIITLLMTVYKYYESIELDTTNNDKKKKQVSDSYISSILRRIKFFLRCYSILCGESIVDIVDINKKLNQFSP